MKVVKYKHTFLAKNSEAFKLFEEGKFKELDAHLKQMDKTYEELMTRYDKKKPD